MEGHSWRLLAHAENGPVELYSPQYIADQKKWCEEHNQVYKEKEVPLAPDSEFDEIVVDKWLHVEKMDDGHYWMRIGDARVEVSVNPDGTAKSVFIERNEYD